MDVELRRRVEVETVHSLLEDLDYYRLMRLKPGAPTFEVERAFSEQSQAFHPDRFFGVRDPKFSRMVTTVYKKISEAYQVLKDPELKRMYDKKLGVTPGSEATHSVRDVNKAALEKERDRSEVDDIVTDKRARKYYELAVIARNNEDWNGVVMNIQFAMNYEKDNERLKKELNQARGFMDDKKKKNQNPYKIKIV